MAEVPGGSEKLIVSPELASLIAWRNVPAPLSAALVTVIVAASSGIALRRSASPGAIQ